MAKGSLAGDFRDFDRIRAWADSIADQLTAAQTDFAESDLPQAHPSIVHTPKVFPGGTTVRTG